MINKSFETRTSNKSVQTRCSDLYLKNLKCFWMLWSRAYFSGRYPTTAMTETEMNGLFDY